jgi:hypothetical protein
MIIQYSLVALALVFAVLYLTRQTWRTWTSSRSGCGGGCCAKAGVKEQPSSEGRIPGEQLTIRVRRPGSSH